MTLNPNPRWSIAGLRQSFAFLLLCSLPFVAVLSGSDLYLHFLPRNQLTSERLVLMGLMMRPFAKEKKKHQMPAAYVNLHLQVPSTRD